MKLKFSRKIPRSRRISFPHLSRKISIKFPAIWSLGKFLIYFNGIKICNENRKFSKCEKFSHKFLLFNLKQKKPHTHTFSINQIVSRMFNNSELIHKNAIKLIFPRFTQILLAPQKFLKTILKTHIKLKSWN